MQEFINILKRSSVTAMVFRSKLVISAIFALVQFVRSDKIFPYQYLGNYFTQEEYDSREKCDTTVCLEDADRLIYAATRDGLIKPCDDFKTFAMGEFFLHRKKNDRYPGIGFDSEVDILTQVRYKNVLEATVNKDDLKVHKFMKSYFRQCADLGQIRKHGGDEVLAYLNSLGGSPLIANGTWDQTKLDVTKLFELNPFALYFLTGHGISRCELPSEDPEQDKRDLICLKVDAKRNDTIGLKSILKKFNKFEESKQQKAIEDYEEFFKLMNSSYYSEVNTSPKFMRIKDLSAGFPQVKINWLELFNNRLFSTSQVTEDEEIFIEHPNRLNQTLTILSTMDKGVIANAFNTQFLLNKSKLAFTHFLKTEDAEWEGTKQSEQRYETCIRDIQWILQLALDSLLAKEKFQIEIQNAAKEFVREAVADYVAEVKERQTTSDEQELIKQDWIEKLKNIQLQVMFPDEALNDPIIEKLYNELDFNESMSYIDLQLAMESYHFKVIYEKESSWIRALEKKASPESIKYLIEENILIVPARYTLPPYFVVNRSRFFNVATLYVIVHGALSKSQDSYLNKKKFDTWFLNVGTDSTAYKYYVKWEESGGKELQLSSFKLTNRQMLWLCNAHVFLLQHHSDKSKLLWPIRTLQIDNYNIILKHNINFREAFQCGDDDLTQQEKDAFSEFVRKYEGLIIDTVT